MSAQIQPTNDESQPPDVIAVYNPENQLRRGLALNPWCCWWYSLLEAQADT